MPPSSPDLPRSQRRLVMSSHREAPEISKDPVADNTDLYAFVDPNDASKVTIIANYIPLEEPAGGPNFFQFGDDVLYEIKIDNDGDAVEDVTDQPVVEHATALLRDASRKERRRPVTDGPRDRSRLAAGAHRTSFDTGLPGAGERGDPDPARRT